MPRLLPLLPMLVASLALCDLARAGLPAGFTKTPVAGPWDNPVGVAFDDNGRMYVWERAGRVWIVENGVKSATPLVDISDEVGNWYEHGMLGFALHPNFLSNGFIYLFYAVDHYNLLNAGSPSYDPNQSDSFVASIGRITRYTATSASGFRAVDPASRRVLLGEAPSTGCPLLFWSHGVGSLVFGSDDSLLASCGDGASFTGGDIGGPSQGAYTVQALAEGIISPREDVGAYRAQLPSSLAGKLLRLDPDSGDGVPGNPYYDAGNPRAARSRVFALGLRNAFRFTVRPDTGSHLAADGNPGSIYLGDVGFNHWEEIDVVQGPANNFGWPIYEGMDFEAIYGATPTPANLDAPNPLNGIGGCATPFFSFRDLLVQDTQSAPSYPNPCDSSQQVPASIPRYVHRRPTLTYGRDDNGPMRVPTFTLGAPTFAEVGAPGSPVPGTPLGGSTASGGVWYRGDDFPPEYKNTYFQGELGSGWIASIRFDASDKPTLVTPFETQSTTATVMLATNPKTGGLYAADISGNVFRYSYAPAGNQPPKAVAVATPAFGATPASVVLDGTASSDPEGLPLTYLWNFGDGTSLGTIPNPIHVFFGPVGVPTVYNVTLTVRDSVSQPSVAQTTVTVNDTPPAVTILSPQSQGLYPMTGGLTYALGASISDAEQGAGQLTCQWQTTLHHDSHTHAGPIDSSCNTSSTIQALGCNGNLYFYTFKLTVTDPIGLATTREVALYPDCAPLFPVICGNIDANATRNAADVTRLRNAFANPLTAPLSAGERARCSVIGDTTCDLVDLVVLRRYLAARAPGVWPVCSAASP
jgi:glucose/arabinose dehydrogenase